MSEYSIRPGGSLRLKGGVAEGGIVKKYVLHSWSVQLCINKYTRKKKKKPKIVILTEDDRDAVEALPFQEEEGDNVPSESGRSSPPVSSSSSSRKTDAEKRFEAAQERRVRFTISYSLNIYCFAL